MPVDLGNDRWAEVMPVLDVPRRIKHDVQNWALTEANRKDGMHDGMIQIIIRDMLIARCVTSWSFGEPPGGDVEKVRDLPSGVYDKLIEATQAHYDDLDFVKELRLARSTAARSSGSNPGSEASPSPGSSPATGT